MECVVQGIIETQHVDALEILLHGLCGVPKEQVRVHELCLKSGPNLGVVPSEVHLLCDLAQPTPLWTVRHVGGAMRGAGADQISVLVRTVVESKVSNNVLRFFYGLGYKLDHEILKVGFSFTFHRGAQIYITVTSAHKMPKLHAIDEAVPITPNIHMVEITAPATAENYNEVVAAVSAFCEYLAPLLHLSKPGVSAGIVPTAAAAAASLKSKSTGVPWSEEEHKAFLSGLHKLGKGDWRGISRNFVATRTPTQVASHAQKYFLRKNNLSKKKRRCSLFDVVGSCERQANVSEFLKRSKNRFELVESSPPVPDLAFKIPSSAPTSWTSSIK